MGKSVAPCGVGFLIGRLWNIKTDVDHGLEGFSLTAPRIARNARSEVRSSPFFGGGQQNGACTRTQNRTLGMSIHPFKQGTQKGFIATGDAHGGGFSTRQHQRIERFVHMVCPAALHNLNCEIEFFGRAA